MIERANSEGATGIQDQVIGLSSAPFQSPDHPITQSPDFSESPDQPINRSPDSSDPVSPFLSCDPDAPGGPLPDESQLPDEPEAQNLGPGSPAATGPGTVRRRPRRSGSSSHRGTALPQFVQALAEQMLAQGASAEEVASAARECGFSKITPVKVRRWLGYDRVARERIIRRQVKIAKDLQASFDAAEGAPDALRAEAMRLEECAGSAAVGESSAADVQDLAEIHRSLRAQLQTENDSLKRRAKRLEARKVYLAKRIEQAQMRVDHARLEVVQHRLGDLRHALEGSEAAEQKPGGSVFADIVSSLCQLLKIGE